MAFYNLLVSAGAVDPEPLRRDIAASRFSTIILLEDVRTDHPPLDVEISTLPAAQLEEIRKHYTLVEAQSRGRCWTACTSTSRRLAPISSAT